MSYAVAAGKLCNNKKFWAYMNFQQGEDIVRHRDHARDWLCSTLDIVSRKELDTPGPAQEKWLVIIRDFNQYLATGFQLIPKKTRWKNQDILDLACVAPCMRCHAEAGQGVVVAAHVAGDLASLFGKGKSIKASDFAVAYLCATCHSKMDNYLNHDNSTQRMLEFAVLIIRTYEWLLRHEFMIVQPNKEFHVEQGGGF